MAKSTTMGMNRTGFAMSPFDSPKTAAYAEEATPDDMGDGQAIAVHRGRFVAEATPIGSVPLPGSPKGAVKSAASKLTGTQPEVLIDKLGERLAFERTGTRLYDALIAKLAAADAKSRGDIPPAGHQALESAADIMGVAGFSLAAVRHMRDEEHAHFLLVAEAMKSLGADPTAQTPSADVAAVANMGVLQVVTDPRTSVPHCLDAMLIAELTDHAAWELLIELAEQGGHTTMADKFGPALAEEEEHLANVRRWLSELMGRELH